MFVSCVGYAVLNSKIGKNAASSERLRNVWQQIHIQHRQLWNWTLTSVCAKVIPSRVTVQLFAEWHCKVAFTQFKDSKKYNLMPSLDRLLELLVMIKFQTHSKNFPWFILILWKYWMWYSCCIAEVLKG